MTRKSSRKKVLIIEDNESLLQVLQLFLTYHGFEVALARTASRGINEACRVQYDVIVLDNGLPDHSGIKVCSDLRSHDITTPILLLTGDNTRQSRSDAIQAGADYFLQKPFDNSELLAKLNELSRRNY